MDRDLTTEEQMLQATREAAQFEKERRVASEEELRLLCEVLSDYIYEEKIVNENIYRAKMRARVYLRKLGVK
ncbi:MAG: hypothetical protein ACTSW7_01265 [Candidatus Thorarchaeota archaeon]|nr:hypothetical protein [Thermoplasmatales archaeon]